MDSEQAPKRNTRFKPGQSGNPKGRPKKKPQTLASALEKVGQEMVLSTDCTMIENFARSLFVQGVRAKGNGPSTLMRALKETSIFAPPGGTDACHPILLIPASIDPDEWEKAVAAQQAKWAGNIGEDSD